jgi:hypothetical protein
VFDSVVRVGRGVGAHEPIGAGEPNRSISSVIWGRRCAKKKDNGAARWANWARIEHKAAAAKARWANTQRQRLRQTTMSWKSWIAPPTMAATSKNSVHTLRT